ncbi:GIY-YIG nuclease family protein [Reyranella sp.]|uniref:GIY-YIG nuclease family protein n=1 Tax=Reyranella sp. TaxID=1929291 RepID=UPI0025F528E1|nr:GIY-YIG nuclease family protein [Reyranella sp.]
MALLREGQRKAQQRMKAGEGFLYVAAVTGADIIKIGFSLRPEARVKHLKGRFGVSATLETMTPGSHQQERHLHIDLREHHLPGYGCREFYPRSVLSHPAIPDGLRKAA